MQTFYKAYQIFNDEDQTEVNVKYFSKEENAENYKNEHNTQLKQYHDTQKQFDDFMNHNTLFRIVEKRNLPELIKLQISSYLQKQIIQETSKLQLLQNEYYTHFELNKPDLSTVPQNNHHIIIQNYENNKSNTKFKNQISMVENDLNYYKNMAENLITNIDQKIEIFLNLRNTLQTFKRKYHYESVSEMYIEEIIIEDL